MLSPFPHQQEGAGYALRRAWSGRRGAYLHHGVGTGKTRTAVAVARNIPAKRIVVICPVVALGVWEREIKKWGDDLDPFVIPLAPGTAWPHKVMEINPSVMFVLTNYDQLIGSYGRKRLEILLKWKPDLLIVDEAQYVKSPTAQRTRAIWKLSKASKFTLLLSGTPTHSPLDWWSQMRMVEPNDPMWADTFSEYRRKVAVLGGPTGSWVTGFRSPVVQSITRTSIEPYVHTVPPDVLKLPEPLVTPILFDLDSESRKIYEQMRREMLTRLVDGSLVNASTVLVQLLRLRQVASGFIQDGDYVYRVGGMPKFDALKELIDLRPNEAIVVATAFKQSLEFAAQLCDRTLRIDGGTKSEDRKRIEDEFQKSGMPFVLVLNYQAGGVAITLTRAKTLILYDLPLSIIEYEQMVGRVWRSGQLGHVQVLPLIARGTVDERIWQSLQQKHSQADILRQIMQEKNV